MKMPTHVAVGAPLLLMLAGGCASMSGERTGAVPITSSAVGDTVARAVDPVDGARMHEDVTTLAGFGTRHTLSETESDSRGIGAARRWLKAEFERIAEASGRTGPGSPSIYFDRHTVEPDGRRITERVDVVNVVCEIPGSMPSAADRRIYVIAHYDSRASGALDAESDAPGANDDASGVAVCLELARVLMPLELDATVVLMPTAGEEQGLFGARLHARAARDRGDRIDAVLNNDTVGDGDGPGGRSAHDRVRVFSEGIPVALLNDDRSQALARLRRESAESDGTSRQLARYIAEVAGQHDLPVKPMLVHRADRYLRGGDHTGFNEQGFAAIRFIEVYEDYTKQHQDVRIEDGIEYGDTAEHVDPAYLEGVAKLNAASVVHLANAPSVPKRARIIVAELSNDTTLRWDESPEPDVVGYEIVWRETTSPSWQHATEVGDVTEATIDLSKDHWFFGVRAVDRDGYRSPVAFPYASRD
ncbi:MAG: M28 family metallopeptidase [Planctomycetota bacterium]